MIIPDKPTAATPLHVNYNVRDAGGSFIQYVFRWYVDNELVQEGPNASIEPGKYKKGSSVFVEITPSDSFSTGKTVKTDTITILDQAPSIVSVSLSPDDPPVGTLLTAAVSGSDPDGDDVKYLYQWRVNEKIVTEKQESSQFNTTGLKRKDMVYAAVWPSDGELVGEVAASNIVVLSNRPPQITSVPVSKLENGIYTYHVTAVDPDNDRITYSLDTAPPGMTIDNSTGLIQWEAPKQVAEKQEIPVKIKVADGDGAAVYQEYSLFLEMK